MASVYVSQSPPPPYLPMEPIATAPAPGGFAMPYPTMPQPGIPMPQPGISMLQPGMPMKPSDMPLQPPGMLEPQPDMPILSQGGWLTRSTSCPPGLECLMGLDHLHVQEQVNLFEAFDETHYKYSVMNTRCEPMYKIIEKSGICARLCLGASRSCEFHVINSDRRGVLRMVRPYRFGSCCCRCCLQELEVYSGETFLGSVLQDFSLWERSFSVRNASSDTVLIIKKPLIPYCAKPAFKVKSADDIHTVGAIQKRCCESVPETLTGVADFLGITFPLDLDVKMKAVLLGACLLIDFMYFQGKNCRRRLI